jgi:tetratricopeptide (TPR) repeat protein
VRATVLDNPALAKHAGRFVWLSIDTEDARNAAFVEHAEVEGYPSFLVVDPASEQVVLRWLGSLTVGQLEALLDDGERAARKSGGSEAEAALARADRLRGEGKSAEAATAYEEALGAAPPGWPRRDRAVESLIVALYAAGEAERCARVAMEEAPALTPGPSAANAAAFGLGCALGASETDAWREEALAALEPVAESLLTVETILADDRSGLWGMLVDVRSDRGDEAGAKRMAEAWIEYLEAEAGRASNPEERAAFDSHRVSAALALGDPARAIPPLEASERDLPDDYNPPARLALVYRELGRHDDALAAADRALARAYGPRKLRIYDLRADVLTRQGKREAAAATLDEALRYATELPESQRPDGLVSSLEERRAELGSGGS